MIISLLVTSPIVKGSRSNHYNCFWHPIAWPDLSNRRWQQFASISSVLEWGCNAHVKTVVLVVHYLLRTRLFLSSSYLFCSWTRFSSPWISWAAVIDQDDPLWTSLELNFFQYHQNLLLKLFFYSPILANNNLLLKIYCENIMVTFLNCHFLFFILFFLSFIHTFFFLLFFLHYTCIPTPISILPFFSTSFSYTWFQNPSLSLSNSFFFYLIPKHPLALFVIRNKERGRERKNRREILLAPPLIEGHRPAENRRSLCQATPSAPPPLVFLPNAAQMGQMTYVLFFFFFFFFFLLLLLWFD